MKQVIAISVFIGLAFLFLTGCHNVADNHRSSPSPSPSPAGVANITVTNIEIRPNPYHLWASSNYKAGEYSVIVSVTNTGTATCSSSLFFTLKVIKADEHGNFNSPEKVIGGTSIAEAILPNETKYVVIPIDAWVTLATAQGDFTSIVGTYKTKLQLNVNDPININQNFPEPLFQVVSGG
jgi:hypothetical protein